MIPAENFQALVDEARAGDRRATERLLALIRPHLEQLAREYADPERAGESTADLVQEAWLRAWQKLAQFSGGGGDDETLAMFRAWVGQIVRTVGVDAWRARNAARRRPARPVLPLGRGGSWESGSAASGLLPEDSGPTPSGLAARDEEARRIRQALGRIGDAADRELIRLYFFEELPLREIAVRLELSYEQVKYRYRGCIRLLEAELGGEP